MKKYKYLFFDLDGTIVDSSKGVYGCFRYAMEKMGFYLEDESRLREVIGPPLVDSFMSLCGFTPEDAKKATALYRERYNSIGVYECELYDGIYDTLKSLCKKGYKIVLATSKPKVFAEKIIEKFALEEIFFYIGGAEIGGISTKEEVLEDIISKLGISDRSSVILIGDTRYDMAGAQFAGIDALGVTYGFGTLEELREYNTVGIVGSPCDIDTMF